MNLDLFLARLTALQQTIAITTPVVSAVKRSYWGSPAGAVTDLPCIINALTEPERTLGMGARREEKYRINVQLLAARATPEDERSSRIATNFWFSAKDVFDANPTVGGTVMYAILRGASPTVPVILQHGGQAYIGFDAFLDVHNIRS
ncbi:MAG: hypothetical protein DDT20_01224 [Firmicutes bacterium]|nr:hypothetical protein [Bacillota bacterium]